jgi:chemotaxis protein MotC
MLAGILAAGVAHGQDGKGEPFELVRSLQSLQDQAARGNTRAQAQQRALIARIAEQFEALDADAWKDPRNARAAVVFVLSGGSAKVLQKLVQAGAGATVGEQLVKGSLAFGEGRLDEARELLGDIEVRALDPSMAGHVAYVQGELVAKKDPAKALAHLDDARLLAPGTLIEEAALRRQIALLNAAGNSERYEVLATQYLRRFPHSVYAGGFQAQFAAAIAVRADSDPDRLARLESLLGGVEMRDRRQVYLMIAEAALMKGRAEMAAFAAAHAARLTEDDSAERERARLYEGAALIVTEAFERGLEMLGKVERSRLAVPDTAVLDAALAIATQVRRMPDAPVAGSAPDAADEGPVLGLARKAIAHVDELLGGSEK